MQHALSERAWSFWCCVVQTCKIMQSLQCALWRSAGHQRLHQDFWPKLMGKFLMNLTESWSHAVELGWQGRQEAQYLLRWDVGDVLSSMPRCLPGSLRSVQLPLDHLVEKRDRAVCHQRSNGRRSWNPSDQLMCFGYLPSPGHPERPTSEIAFKPAKWNPSDAQWWEGGQEDLMIDNVKSGR